MSVRLIIFDLDGTLIDSLEDITGALNEALGLPSAAPEGAGGGAHGRRRSSQACAEGPEEIWRPL